MISPLQKSMVILLAGMLVSFVLPSPTYVQSASPTPDAFEVGLPGLPAGTPIRGSTLVHFVDLLLKAVLAIVVAAGLISFVAAGYIYMTAGGNSQRLGTAKSLMSAAILGIVLALVAQLILNTISPQFASEVQEPK